MIYAGIDAGSRAIKVALYDGAGSALVGTGIAAQGVEQSRLAEKLYDEVLGKAGLRREDVVAVVATGYGRNRVAFANTTITEISCHACGVRHLAPATRSIIEIGGQDSKVIRLDDDGRVRDFSMNDRCAAGTGRFLEMLGERLGVPLDSLAALSLRSLQPALISSTCVVFAESEIVGLLAEGKPVEDIAAGVQRAIADRVAATAGAALDEPVIFTGGVALQSGMVRALEDALGCKIHPCPQPQYTGAIGAALLARINAEKASRTAAGGKAAPAREPAGEVPPPHESR